MSVCECVCVGNEVRSPLFKLSTDAGSCTHRNAHAGTHTHTHASLLDGVVSVVGGPLILLFSVDFCCCLRRIFYVWFFSVVVVVVSDFVLTCFLLLPFFSFFLVCLDFVLFLLFGLFWSVIWFCCFLLRPVAFFSGGSVTPVVVFVDFCPGFNFRWSLLFIFCFFCCFCV